MNEPWFRIWALAVLASSALALSACGDVSGESSTGTSAAATTSTTPPSTGTTSGTGSGGTSATAVELSGSPAKTITAGTAYRFEPTLDQGSGTVTYSITGKPSWATFSTATGMLSGTPGSADEGTSALITISASNGSSSASLAPFSIQVAAPGVSITGSATLSWTAPTTNVDGTPVTDLAGYHIYYGTSESSLTDSVTVTSPTETSYVINGLAQGTFYFSVVAFNSMGIDSSDSNFATKDIT